MWHFLHPPPKHRFRHTADYWCPVKVFYCLFPKGIQAKCPQENPGEISPGKSWGNIPREIMVKYPQGIMVKYPRQIMVKCPREIMVRFAHESVGFINY